MSSELTHKSAFSFPKYLGLLVAAWVSAEAVDVFARANARVWEQIARAAPHPWKRRMAEITREWAENRRAVSTGNQSELAQREPQPDLFS